MFLLDYNDESSFHVIILGVLCIGSWMKRRWAILRRALRNLPLRLSACIYCSGRENAGVSVGVIYKCFGDKDTFFLACVRTRLNCWMQPCRKPPRAAAAGGAGDAALILALSASRAATRAITRCTTRSPPAAAGSMPTLAREIESRTAALYTRLFDGAQRWRTAHS